MSLAYAALASEGPVSAQHVTGLLARGTDAGVIWPGPLQSCWRILRGEADAFDMSAKGVEQHIDQP